MNYKGERGWEYTVRADSIEELKLNDNAYLYNIICFNNENSAIDYRKVTMNNGWSEVSSWQLKDSIVTEYKEEYFQYEYQIHPSKILRIIKNLMI